MSKDNHSSCSSWGLHDYEVKNEDATIMVEICTKCGNTQRYNKMNKRIDDDKYIGQHARDALQPFDKPGNFKREYGREY